MSHHQEKQWRKTIIWNDEKEKEKSKFCIPGNGWLSASIVGYYSYKCITGGVQEMQTINHQYTGSVICYISHPHKKENVVLLICKVHYPSAKLVSCLLGSYTDSSKAFSSFTDVKQSIDPLLLDATYCN